MVSTFLEGLVSSRDLVMLWAQDSLFYLDFTHSFFFFFLLILKMLSVLSQKATKTTDEGLPCWKSVINCP